MSDRCDSGASSGSTAYEARPVDVSTKPAPAISISTSGASGSGLLSATIVRRESTSMTSVPVHARDVIDDGLAAPPLQARRQRCREHAGHLARAVVAGASQLH